MPTACSWNARNHLPRRHGTSATPAWHVLIDSRLEPQRIDLAFIRYLGEHGVPFGIIFTKADKSKPGQLKSHINAFLHTLGEEWEELPPHFVTSSNDGTGRDELLNYIEQVNQSL